MAQDSKEIKKLIESLNERTKELECLYKTDELLKDFDLSINKILSKLVDIIPDGWQFNEICKARVIYNDTVYKTSGFKRTELKQSANIIVNNEIVGEIQICYIRPVKLERKRIFLIEEQKLIETIADKVSSFIINQNLRQSIKESRRGVNALNMHMDNKETSELTGWLREMRLTDDEISQIGNVKLNFKKGETICKQGAFASYVMLITEGLSKIYTEGTANRSFNVKLVNSHDIIGLTSLFGNNYYHFSAKAITPVTVYLIEKDLVISFLENNKHFAKIAMEWYCNNSELIFGRLSCIATKQSLGRMAEILLYLARIVFKSDIISSSITRRDIAELTGMSTESAVRILSELKSDNVIKLSKSGIEIIDYDLLKTLSIAG